MKKNIITLLAILASIQLSYSATMVFSGGTPPGWDSSIAYNHSIGTEFTVGSQPIQVFRIWDIPSRIYEPDTVGIWDLSGNLLTSVSFSNDDFGSSNYGKYLGGSYLAAPITLNPNTSYILGAGNTSGFMNRTPLWNATISSNDGQNYFSLVGAFMGQSAYSFDFPQTAFYGGSAWLSPTIEFNVVPEPSTYALFGLGTVGILVAVRRRRLC